MALARVVLSDPEELAAKACEIRKHIVRMIGEASSGHPGGSLSAADIVTVLLFQQDEDSSRRSEVGRSRQVRAFKGHAAPVLYAALAEAGYFPVDDLVTLRKIDSHLQGHPDMNQTPGVEMSTGSLGQGCLQRAAWRLPPRWMAPTGACMLCWATARSKRARCGRPP